MKTLHPTSILIFAVAALALASCKTKEQYAGVEGDFVSGVPLPERQDGAGFTSGNVSRGQFPPVQFGFVCFVVCSSEMGMVDAVASAM